MEHTVENNEPLKAQVATENTVLEWFTDIIYPRYSKIIWGVGGSILGAVAIYALYTSTSESRMLKANKELGAAYVLLAENKTEEAEKSLQEFLLKGGPGLAQDKAHLYLGKLYYQQQKYDQSLEAYEKVGSSGNGNLALLYSGALHGRAACHMQKKEYAKAVVVLDKMISQYMRKTGNPKENRVGEEVVDLIPTIPNALWKQALCYRELHNIEKVRSVVEQLRKVYPTSPEAQNGIKLIAMME